MSPPPPHSIELDEPPLVETAAHLFKASCYRYREELTAGILVAGWDKRKGGQVKTRSSILTVQGGTSEIVKVRSSGGAAHSAGPVQWTRGQ